MPRGVFIRKVTAYLSVDGKLFRNRYLAERAGRHAEFERIVRDTCRRRFPKPDADRIADVLIKDQQILLHAFKILMDIQNGK